MSSSSSISPANKTQQKFNTDRENIGYKAQVAGKGAGWHMAPGTLNKHAEETFSTFLSRYHLPPPISLLESGCLIPVDGGNLACDLKQNYNHPSSRKQKIQTHTHQTRKQNHHPPAHILYTQIQMFF